MPGQDDSFPDFEDVVRWLIDTYGDADLTMEQLQQARAKHVAERAYRASPIKRRRRTRQEMDAIRAAICGTVEADHPATVRQIFYRLVTAGVIAKTEAEYKGTVCRLLVELRESGLLPYHWIADNTRWMRKPTTYTSLGHMLQTTKTTYRRALWADQRAYVEIWCEK